MIYGFDTDDGDAATAALCLYVMWRSRDMRRFKITPTVWEQIERFAKAAAKRADSLPRWIETMKPRLSVGTLSPKWMAVGLDGVIPLAALPDGALVQLTEPEQHREFLTSVIARANQRAALDMLYRETAWVVLLVRDRLERERPVEARFAVRDDSEETTWT